MPSFKVAQQAAKNTQHYQLLKLLRMLGLKSVDVYEYKFSYYEQLTVEHPGHHIIIKDFKC
jgi:hypothetical protein